ncbi:MAG: phosphopantetheine adenylyltransferase [Candidatus Micrarchaeota archaeon]|nr:phosphopantetheine adenylyltransferase [Candidatus Micrarchaeota archaeon]
MSMKVIVGGTFAYLHKGHRALLRKAFMLGDTVVIGLTTDAFVKSRKGAAIKRYSERRRELVRFVARFGKKFRIQRLNDRNGTAASGNFDAIVVSQETVKAAKEINLIRRKSGLDPLRIVKVGMVKAYDRLPISSSRIYAGEIDINGNKAMDKRHH